MKFRNLQLGATAVLLAVLMAFTGGCKPGDDPSKGGDSKPTTSTSSTNSTKPDTSIVPEAFANEQLKEYFGEEKLNGLSITGNNTEISYAFTQDAQDETTFNGSVTFKIFGDGSLTVVKNKSIFADGNENPIVSLMSEDDYNSDLVKQTAASRTSISLKSSDSGTPFNRRISESEYDDVDACMEEARINSSSSTEFLTKNEGTLRIAILSDNYDVFIGEMKNPVLKK